MNNRKIVTVLLICLLVISVLYLVQRQIPRNRSGKATEVVFKPEARLSPTPNYAAPPLRTLAGQRGILIGAAVSSDALEKDEKYASVLGREFNMLTPENEMKFEAIHPQRDQYDFINADRLVAFAEENGMRVRGHTLVWHQQLPEWVKGASDGELPNCEQMEGILLDHIQTVVGHYKGRVYAWDVVNEAVEEDGSLRQTVWSKCIGEDYLSYAFRWAHEADPEALLFYNDYNTEWPGAKSEAVYELVKKLKSEGIPIVGVGLQMHLENAPSPRYLESYLKRLSGLGVQVQITELDVRLKLPTDAEALAWQAQVYGDVLMVCQRVENCTGLSLWGFTDLYSWIPGFFKGYGEALIFDKDYNPKTAYWELSRLLGIQ